MTPLDHLRFWLASLDEDLQHEIAFALVPALVYDPNGRCFRSERDFGIKDLSEWLAPTRFALRGIGKVTSAAAMIDYVFGEAPSQEPPPRGAVHGICIVAARGSLSRSSNPSGSWCRCVLAVGLSPARSGWWPASRGGDPTGTERR